VTRDDTEVSTRKSGSEGAGRAGNIIRGIGSLSVQSALNSILGFFLLGSLLRLLPPLAYGAYSALLATLGVGGALATFGLNAAVVRFLGAEQSRSGGSGWGATKASLVLTLLLSSITSLALVLGSRSLSLYFMKSPDWAWVFGLGALWLFSSSLSGILQSITQSLRRYSLLAGILLVSRFAAVAFAVGGLLLYRDLSVAILSWILFASLISILTLKFVWRPTKGSSPKGHYLPVLRYSVPLGLAGVVGVVASSADVFVVGGYLDPVSLGVYYAAITIATILSALFVGPLSTAVFAETSFSSENKEEVARGTSLATRFALLTVLPASFVAAALANQLFLLFSGGGQYVAGVPSLQLITLFYTFVALQSIFVNVLQGVGRTKQVLVIGILAAASDLALSVLLVPMFGLAGAALSRVAVMIVGALSALYYLRGHLTGLGSYNFFARALVASAIPGVIAFNLSSYVSNRIVTLLPYTVLAVAVFLLCVRWFKLLNFEDKVFLGHLLPQRLKWVLRLL